MAKYIKTVLLVPGFREQRSSRDYQSVIRAIEARGHKVIFVPITWQRTTIMQWLAQLDKVYAAYDPAQTILAGFSFGAMTVFVEATKRQPAELWLFSLSPYFANDLTHLKQAWLRSIGQRRAAAFKTLDFTNLASKLTCKTLIFVGETEMKSYPTTGNRAILAEQAILGSRKIIVPLAGHDITDPNYVAAIQTEITDLS